MTFCDGNGGGSVVVVVIAAAGVFNRYDTRSCPG